MQPKLSVKPSEVIARQVHCGFQYDRSTITLRMSWRRRVSSGSQFVTPSARS